jgi:hypothetical protein
MRNQRSNPSASYWQQEDQTLALGCNACPDLDICGGLRGSPIVLDCRGYCRRPFEQRCEFVCQCDPANYVARKREVDGFSLKVLNAAAVSPPPLPIVVPLLYHGYRRKEKLRVSAVAFPLEQLFSKRTGTLLFTSREQVLDYVRCDRAAALVISGVADDRALEAYWSTGRHAELASWLRQLRPALVTTPNFSLFCDVPRWDNLHNMKRIAICWHELASQNLAVALHVNARTDHDWSRWYLFLKEHREISSLSFEFKTGPASPERGKWHASRLCSLADRLERRLHLVSRGGLPHLGSLRRSFETITLIATDPVMRSVHRQRLSWRSNGRIRWVPNRLPPSEPIDRLLQSNVQEFTEMVRQRFLSDGYRLAGTQMELPGDDAEAFPPGRESECGIGECHETS